MGSNFDGQVYFFPKNVQRIELWFSLTRLFALQWHFDGTFTAIPRHFHNTSMAEIFFGASIRIERESHCLPYAGFFCIAINASRRFIWAIKNNDLIFISFFYHKGGPLWFRGAQFLSQPLNMVEKWKEKHWENFKKNYNQITGITCKYSNSFYDSPLLHYSLAIYCWTVAVHSTTVL